MSSFIKSRASPWISRVFWSSWILLRNFWPCFLILAPGDWLSAPLDLDLVGLPLDLDRFSKLFFLKPGLLVAWTFYGSASSWPPVWIHSCICTASSLTTLLRFLSCACCWAYISLSTSICWSSWFRYRRVFGVGVTLLATDPSSAESAYLESNMPNCAACLVGLPLFSSDTSLLLWLSSARRSLLMLISRSLSYFSLLFSFAKSWTRFSSSKIFLSLAIISFYRNNCASLSSWKSSSAASFPPAFWLFLTYYLRLSFSCLSCWSSSTRCWFIFIMLPAASI